ncbi:MAG TPA: UDP-N-acetylglucosamine 2-epimerase, partial [Candidatus Cloacimonadota bacterium]|nr:UDP-N-acetylglucosamine 2-epimerase [Candidatus Cloacimonadota bacterium]
SGGVQKEAYFLQKPCITLRNETEWIETLDHNWNILCGTDTEKIIRAINETCGEQSNLQAFGDGNAAEKIIKLILERIK